MNPKKIKIKKPRPVRMYKYDQIKHAEKLFKQHLRSGSIWAHGERRELMIKETFSRLLIEETGSQMTK